MINSFSQAVIRRFVLAAAEEESKDEETGQDRVDVRGLSEVDGHPHLQ